MSYLCYLCLFAYSGVQHILCCVFVLFLFLFRLVSCVPYVASLSGLSIKPILSIFLELIFREFSHTQIFNLVH